MVIKGKVLANMHTKSTEGVAVDVSYLLQPWCNLSAKEFRERRRGGLNKLTFHPGVFTNSVILRRTSAMGSILDRYGHEKRVLNGDNILQAP